LGARRGRNRFVGNLLDCGGSCIRFDRKNQPASFGSSAGGTTEAMWREDNEMLITGRADLAFCGEYFQPSV
jgi:hypothetical protein